LPSCNKDLPRPKIGGRFENTGLAAMARLIRDVDDLVEAIRARRDELGISYETMDAISGLSPGHCAKLSSGAKGIGRVSLPAVLGALGAALVLVEDPEQTARVADRWRPRQRKPRTRC
jgi:hypothetical protein